MFHARQRRHKELLKALDEINIALRILPHRIATPSPEQLDYHKELKKIAYTLESVEGAAELLSRWLALQLPPEARSDVPIPKEWT